MPQMFPASASAVVCLFLSSILYLCSLPAPLSGENPALPSPLSLRDAVRIALERNPAVGAAQNTIEMAEALQLDAAKRLNPAFSFCLGKLARFQQQPRSFFSNAGNHRPL